MGVDRWQTAMKIQNPTDFERLVAEADGHPFSDGTSNGSLIDGETTLRLGTMTGECAKQFQMPARSWTWEQAAVKS